MQFVGKQRPEEYVEKSRIPYPSMESINWLNKKEGLFNYHWSLYSAGHAELDINKDAPKELMIRERDRENSWLLGDSGGFQIGKGVWEGDWKDPTAQSTKEKRTSTCLDGCLYGLWYDSDIPAWVSRSPAGAKATGISTYSKKLLQRNTYSNNDYFMKIEVVVVSS